jgi:hypothetical protein
MLDKCHDRVILTGRQGSQGRNFPNNARVSGQWTATATAAAATGKPCEETAHANGSGTVQSALYYALGVPD